MLHPAAQAIVDAYQSEITVEDGLAAVIEKLADMKFTELPEPKWYEPVRPSLLVGLHRKDLLNLADHLRLGSSTAGTTTRIQTRLG